MSLDVGKLHDFTIVAFVCLLRELGTSCELHCWDSVALVQMKIQKKLDGPKVDHGYETSFWQS